MWTPNPSRRESRRVVVVVVKVLSVLVVLLVGNGPGAGASGGRTEPSLHSISLNLDNSSWDLKDEFGREDLVDLVRDLEREAQDDEQAILIPEIMEDFLEGALLSSQTQPPTFSTPIISNANESGDTRPPEFFFISKMDGEEGSLDSIEGKMEDDEDDEEEEEEDDEDEEEDMVVGNSTADSEGEGSLPADLSDLPEDIANDITAGVEESLRLFDDSGAKNGSVVETRQLSMYLFQGQYVSEPRLNRFIDGAFRNMGTEMRISSMDPLYFRVLPRGRVEQRNQGQALYGGVRGGGGKKKGGVRRRRPGKKRRVGRDTSAVVVEDERMGRDLVSEGRGVGFNLRRRQKQKKARLRRQKLRRKRLRAKRRRNKRCRKSRRCRKTQGRRNKKNRRRRQKKKRRQKQKKKKLRIRRRTKQNVGGGRVEGLSNVQRDADAEMQLFGNYTLIRSHMKIGPVELSMQFRTKKGIRRTGATLPFILAHTVTRVNHEGSEMVDFLLDRPHPEMIRVRGNLFPKAQNIAQNIFSRLFLPDSFLTQRMREKTGLALLSKPIDSP